MKKYLSGFDVYKVKFESTGRIFVVFTEYINFKVCKAIVSNLQLYNHFNLLISLSRTESSIGATQGQVMESLNFLRGISLQLIIDDGDDD